MGVSGGIPAAEANERARKLADELRGHREQERQLAIAVLSLAESAGMPNAFWQTDSRVNLAVATLWPGSPEWDRPPSREWVRIEAGL